MGGCFSSHDDEHKQPEQEEQQHKQEEGKQEEKPEVKENGKCEPAAPGTPAAKEQPCPCACKKADDGEAANPENVKLEEAEQEEERRAKEQRQEKEDKDTVRQVEGDTDYATRQVLYDHMPSTGDYGADKAIHGAVRSVTTGMASMGAGAAVNAKSGRKQDGVDGEALSKDAGITASRTAGDTAGGVAGDQVRENMPETGIAEVDYALQYGADRALREAGGLMGDKGAQKAAEAAEEKELERLKEEDPEEYEKRKQEKEEREEQEDEAMKDKAKGTVENFGGGLKNSVMRGIFS